MSNVHSKYDMIVVLYFFLLSQILQACLGELFHARLGISAAGQEANLSVLFQDQEASSGDLKGPPLDSHAASLLYRLHKPNRGLLSEDVRTECFFVNLP